MRLVGTTWQQLGPGNGVGITVYRLYTLPNGSLLAMGNLPHHRRREGRRQ